MKRVAVFGGGMGGLSAAHELIERGFSVDVYERGTLWGGKARSYGIKDTGTDGREDLPGEHGFRFFPGFYKHVPDTMSRIPFPSIDANARVNANLLQCEVGEFLQEGKRTTIFPVRFPRSLGEFFSRMKDLFNHGPLGFQPHELRFFLGRMLRIAVSCQARRMAVYEKIAWWDFVDAEAKSPAYQNLLARGLTRSLVAMKAETASTRTVGDIMLQMVFYALTPLASSDRVLNGPTSEVWIDPWKKYLASRGVRFHSEMRLIELSLGRDKRIMSASVRAADNTVSIITADHYVAAVPCEVMAKLAAGPIANAAPSLRGLGKLEVEWMNGAQYYLVRDVPMVYGHSIYTGSSWSLTSISQPQFWAKGERPIDRYGNGQVKGLLSVDVSNWMAQGQFTTDKSAAFCTREQILTEVWAQVKAHLAQSGHGPVNDADVLHRHLDHDIECPRPESPRPQTPPTAPKRRGVLVERLIAPKDPTKMQPLELSDVDSEPLLVNTIDSWTYRPQAHTEISNLFLASDYVRTHTDLATMEGANEAGRRAANAILDAVGSTESRAAVFPLKEPWILAPFRAVDWLLFQLHK